MKKRLLSLCITFLLLALLVPMKAEAATVVRSGQLQDSYMYTYWKLYDDGSLVFTGNCNIPNYSWDNNLGRPNTSWHGASENSGTPIKSITFDGSFHSIGKWAFAGLEELESVTFNDSIWYIPEGAFDRCTKLQSVTLPSSLYSIGYLAFAYCDSLETVTILSTDLGFIDSGAFKSCSSLTAITVPEDSENYASVDGVLFNKAMTTLIKYPAGKTDSSYTVPSTVKSISDFSYASNLTSITFPEGLTSFGSSAFEQCTGLTSISIPDGVKTIPFNGFWGCTGLRDVKLPASLTTINDQAFYNCWQIRNITFPEGLKTIGLNAFYNNRISNIVIPASVTTIDSAAFSYNSTTKMTVLSKNCTFADRIFSPYNDRVPEIHGWAGSTAETYAATYSATFTEHNPTNKIATTAEPTCTTVGVDLYDGCYCGIETTVYIDKLPHIMTNKSSGYRSSAATCKSPAKYYVQCDNCTTRSTTITVDVGEIDPNGHNFSDGVCTYCGIIGGKCGYYLYWSYDDEADLLTIYGSDTMYGYSTSSYAPWYTYRNEIKTVNMIGGSSIGSYAFQDMDGLTQVTLPEGLTTIGNNAFVHCGNLETITMPSTVSTLNSNAFQDCASLTAITLPEKITTIQDGVFLNCKNLETVEILGAVTAIGTNAFGNCSSLEGIAIPDNVTHIGDMAFQNCTSLTQVTIPSGVTTLSYNLFAGCKNLADVTFTGNVSTVSSMAFTGCVKLTQIDLPDSVTSIQESAFSMSGLTSFTFPENVTAISGGVLSSCANLETLVIPAGVTGIAANAFSNCDKIADVYFGGTSDAWEALGANRPSATRTHYNTTDPENHWTNETHPATCVDSAYTYEICPCDSNYARNQVATGEPNPRAHSFVDGSCEHCGILGGPCGDNAWWILDNQGNMTIYGEGDMRSYRWSDAPWIEHADIFKTLVVEPGITDISYNAFRNCTELTSVSLPETVEQIADSAFASCSSLTDINIPDSVTSLGPAFMKCSSLISITIPEGITQIGSSSFSDCTSLESVTLPSTVTYIGTYAFSDCSSLESIELPNGLTEIDRFAFENCSSLTTLDLPDSLTSIGAVAFCGCSGLTEMAVPEGITTIDLDTFQDCTGIETLILPASITTINQDAFLRCTPTEVFFGGTKEAWKFKNAPSASYVHYETTEPEGHWYAYTHDMTCTEDGYTCTACDCGYKTNKVVTDTAPGHDWLPSTCVSPSICDLCGAASGNPVPGKHTYENYACIYCGITLGGQCGDDAWWTLDADGLLKITGQGDMWDYAWNGRPWMSHADHIQTIVVEDGITHIGENNFCHSDNLTSVTLADSVISIGAEAFKSCDTLKTIPLPKGLEYIGFDAFAYCYGLTEIEIPNTISTIGAYAFRGCTGLTQIHIPQGVTVLNDGIFWECSNLVSVELPKGLTGIGNYAFFDCFKLKSLSVPAGVTAIGELAFSDCRALEYFVFHGAPTFSTVDVFRNCGNLTDVYYAGAAEEWPKLGEFFEEWSAIFLHYECIQHEGHWETHVQDADCTKDGYTAEICACGHERNKQVTDTSPGHSWTNATCTAPKTCEKCGTTEGSALPHPFTDGKCTVCGADDPNYVPPVTDPDPTEPEPTEPVATEPKPTEPEATEPEVTEPKPTEPAPTEPDATQNVTRLAGADRFETSFLVAEEMKQVLGVSKFDAIVLASGRNFADALSGSYLAAVKQAPILLGYKGEYNRQTILYIQENLAPNGIVYILGGEKAVVTEFDAAFASLGIHYERLAGVDRFETNLMVLREAGINPGDEILVCTGTDFADSLSGSATGLPILLVYKKLTDNQKAYLANVNSNSFCIVGGESAVSGSIEQAISAFGPVDRLAGSNRLLTSVLVAQRYFGNPDSAVVAYGWNFPDGLCGGPLAYTMGSPLILTHYSQKHYAVAADYASGQQIRNGYILGGDGLVGDDATRAIFSMDPQQAILSK